MKKKNLGKLFIAVTAMLLILLATYGNYAQATTIYVPADYLKIQDAIDAVGPSDTVVVSPGIYSENIIFPDKYIDIRSVGGPEVTTIDGGGSGSVISINNSQPHYIEGFTITNGYSPMGAGIHLSNSASPYIGNCIVTNNISTAAGAGIFVDNATPMIENCAVTNNWSDIDGGGIYYASAGYKGDIHGSTISGNTASNGSGGGIAYVEHSYSSLYKCIISDNTAGNFGGGIANNGGEGGYLYNCIINGNIAGSSGGGISSSGVSSFSLYNCTISGNTAGISGGGIASTTIDSYFLVINSILWGDGTAGEIYTVDSLTIDITYSDIQGGWTGTGNIACAPQFAGLSDYHLQSGSCCIDAGTNISPVVVDDIEGTSRPQGAAYDIGAYEFSILCTDGDSDEYAIEGGDCGPVDCDDNNPDINPGALEIPYNGVDDDCNPATKDDDLDSDGYPIATDCDDNNPDVNPGALEVCSNEIDDDCDSMVDCDDGDCSSSCGPQPEVCDDGIDNDMDGKVDCSDKKDCNKDPACSGGPSESEICDDGVDNDGDGKVDCDDRKDCRTDPFCSQ